MDNGAFFEHKELMAFAGVKQKDALMRWLDRQSIPYLVDAKGNPKVKYASIESRYVKKDAEEERVGFAPIHQQG
jgi:hypothetical protein